MLIGGKMVPESTWFLIKMGPLKVCFNKKKILLIYINGPTEKVFLGKSGTCGRKLVNKG